MKAFSKVVGSICVLAAVGSANVSAGPNPFSDCGIGAALFPKHPVGAVISNVIWDVGTTAVTSATASPETCSGENAQAAAFIFESYDSLVEDTARGEGEHLATLLDILNVEASARSEAVSDLRQKQAELIASTEYSAMSDLQKAEFYYDSLIAVAI